MTWHADLMVRPRSSVARPSTTGRARGVTGYLAEGGLGLQVIKLARKFGPAIAVSLEQRKMVFVLRPNPKACKWHSIWKSP